MWLTQTWRLLMSPMSYFLPAGQRGAQDLPVWALRLQGQQDGDPGGWCAHPLGAWLLWQSGQREGARRSVSTHTHTMCSFSIHIASEKAQGPPKSVVHKKQNNMSAHHLELNVCCVFVDTQFRQKCFYVFGGSQWNKHLLIFTVQTRASRMAH